MSKKLYEESNIQDIANAIRSKSGSSDYYKVSEMASAISNIPTGGGDDDSDLINFYDYDGTLVDSVRLSELPLQALPTPPAHEGLTFEKWNWTLADVNALTYPMDVGALYTTTSGATEFYFENIEYGVLNIQEVSPTTLDDIYVDWGDGTIGTYTTNYTHDYATRGDYVVKVYTLSGTGKYRLFGQKSSSVYKTCITNNSTDKYAENLYHLKELHIGQECIRANNYSLYGCGYLQKISVHSQFEIYTNASNSNTEVSVFNDCNMLKYIVLSPVQLYLGKNTFVGNYCLKGISFPKEFLYAYNMAFGTKCVRRICVSENCTRLSDLSSVIGLKKIYTDKNNIVSFFVSAGGTVLNHIDIDKYTGKIKLGPTSNYSSTGGGYISLQADINIQNLSDYDNIVISDCTWLPSFRDCWSLKNANDLATLVPDATGFGQTFIDCYNLETVSLPNSITTGNGSNFQNCYYLKNITLPTSLKKLYQYDFQNCRSLKSITFSSNITSLNNYCCAQCFNLKTVSFLANVNNIPQACFQSCYALTEFEFPSTIRTINANAFQYCYGMRKYDFTNLTAVPTLSNTNAFTGINANCKIVVPDDLYETWIGTTNWSTYADYIVKESEYND